MDDSTNNEEKQKPVKKIHAKYAMDYGLASITTLHTGDGPMKLPTFTHFDPCEGKIEEKLKKVLEIKTLQLSMIKLLRPTVTNRNILTPQQFRLKIQQVCDTMDHSIEENDGTIVNLEALNDVIELLQNEEEKCELLDQYRHMLLMG